ncbi:acyl-CoA dehydrogenase family protein [Halocola ammonii]
MQFSEEEIQQIQEDASKAEATGQLKRDQLAVIYDHGLYKVLLPNEVGGKNLSLPEAADVFRKSSYVDGSFGWAVTIGAGGNFFFDFMEPKVAKEVFSSKEALIAGSGIPLGLATPEKDGFRITGKWKYCSGSPQASAFTFNCFVTDENGEKTDQVKSFVLRPDQIEIEKDWNALGLKATASHTVKVNNAFVTSDRMFDISQPQVNSGSLFFKYPFLEFARVSFAAVVLGLGEAFIEKAQQLAEESKSNWQQPFPDRFPKVKRMLNEQDNEMKFLRKAFFERVEKSWEELEQEGAVSDKLAKSVSEQCFETVNQVQQRTAKIFPWLGMSVLFPENEINRIWRDLQTAGQHILLRDF